VLLEGNFSIIL